MNRFIENYNGREYDIIIIGGGISGAAVAYEASARGYDTALIEKCDFGCGTSSATSKLIHGGLRYLKNFEISVQNGSLTIDAENADVRQILREISVKAGINIVSESNLIGDVTAHLSDVPVEEALYALLTANGFVIDDDNGIYRVRAGGMQQRGAVGSFSILYRNGRISIDVKNAPVADVLSEIASQAKINMATVGNIQGSVTTRLDAVTLDQALDALTDATGNVYTVVDGIYMVGDPTIRPGQTNPLLERKVIWLRYIEAQDVISALPCVHPQQYAHKPHQC